MPNVSYKRPEVANMQARYDLVRDCLDGQEAIKAATDKYLPRPNPSDTSDENRARYKQYVERAVFYNVTQRTLTGMVGQVFKQEPMYQFTSLMEPLEVDVDGAGVAIEQQAKKCLSEVLAYGRCGLFTDYPNTATPASRADILSGNIRPTIILYEPWNIINWRTKTIGAKKVLSLVVLEETYTAADDGFEILLEKQWRVLSLEAETGYYRVGIWRQDLSEAIEAEFYYPRGSNGANMKEIPFTFVGASNNDSDVDLPPLADLANLNIAHYRNSADYEEACYICGQPTPYLSGLTQSWVDDVMKGSIQLGSRAAIPLPVGGTAGLIQAEPNSMPFEAMEHKERQMVALGAKLVEQSSVQRTATEATQEESSEASILTTCAKNVANAYRSALGWASALLGGPEEVEFELNTDLALGTMSAQDRAQLISEWQGGAIAFEEMRDSLRRAGVATMDDEEAKDAIESEMQSGMGAGAANVFAAQVANDQLVVDNAGNEIPPADGTKKLPPKQKVPPQKAK